MSFADALRGTFDQTSRKQKMRLASSPTALSFEKVVSRAGLEPATHWLKEQLSGFHPITTLTIY
jgi:hypothetical protein